jgi:hypothetical protein
MKPVEDRTFEIIELLMMYQTPPWKVETARNAATPTFNQRVHGSSPCAPTKQIKGLGGNA